MLLCALAVLAVAASDADGRPGAPIFHNRSYSPAERAADLVARMTLAEKASQMISGQSPAIPRLGIHAYGWWNEAVHGISRLQLNPTGSTSLVFDTTSYPVSLSLGSTWDPGLMYREASAISDEAREVVPGNAFDLDFFSPTINLSRDPRWGRNDESFSEDPMLTAAIASQYVDGMQGMDRHGHLLPQSGGYLKTVATLKHYAANNSEVNRLIGSSNVDERTLREYYTEAFRLIDQQAHPDAMMASYNAVNGIPGAANPHLIETLARQTFGFDGYFTSDCDAIDGIVTYHRWAPRGRELNRTEAHAYADSAGDDLNCNVGIGDPLTARQLVPAAVGEGIRTSSDVFNVQDVDSSLVRLFTARIRLGEFDHIAAEPWVRAARGRLRPGSWVDSDANRAVTETPGRLQLAREVADRSLVLLKNSRAVLPLRVPHGGPFRVAVIGHLANSAPFLGGYSSAQGALGGANEVTPYAGIKRAIQAIDPSATVDFYEGFTSGGTAASLTNVDPGAVAAAAGYNAVIVYVGTDSTSAREDLDRSSTALPGAQAQLVADVAARNPNTIAVMETVGAVDVGGFEGSVPAIVWSSYNGERAGDALADVLLGRYDPSGHLPFTWYESSSELPPITDYRIRPGAGTPGRTYMYFRGPVSFPFGYGLSYTTFRTAGLRVDRRSVDANRTFHVTVDVTNTGSLPGSDLVQMYIASPGAGTGGRPLKRLEGFQQVPLAPGQTRAVKLTVSVPDLAFWSPGRSRLTVDDGRYRVQVGSSADDVQLQAPVSVHGHLEPVPAVVSAKPTMPGDASRGIQTRVMFPVGTVVQPGLTVAMNDQSLHRVGASSTSPIKVRFHSDRPGVVSVARDGTIRTVRDGVATVTATVTLHGVSKSGQFVVRALSELDRLALVSGSGRGARSVGVPRFEPDDHSYEVIVRGQAGAPRITAASPDRAASVYVLQARRVPGAATVVVRGPDGIGTVYKVYFARPARSDEFSGGRIGRRWTWIRHDPRGEHVLGGALVITAEQGELEGGVHNARNILVQPALGDWTIQSKLRLSAPPHAEGAETGIVAYQDGGDWLKLGWRYSSGAARLTLTTEDSLSGAPVVQVLASLPTAGRLGNAVWLRMVKHGPRYAAYFSRDGVHFARLYETGASLVNVRVGLFAWGGVDTSNSMRVAFAYFHVRESGFAVGAPVRARRPGRR